MQDNLEENLSSFKIKDIEFFSSLITTTSSLKFKINQSTNQIEIYNYAFLILDPKLFEIQKIIEDVLILNSKNFQKYLKILIKNNFKEIKIDYSVDTCFLSSENDDLKFQISMPFYENISRDTNFDETENTENDILRVIFDKKILEKINKFLITKTVKSFEKLEIEANETNFIFKKDVSSVIRELKIENIEFLKFADKKFKITDKFFRDFQNNFISKILLSLKRNFLSIEILFDSYEETYFEWREMIFTD